MVAQYRKLSKRFWTDPRTQDLTPPQRLFFAYAITGREACENCRASGIYEIARSSFENYARLSYQEVEDVIKFFNSERPELLEYDVQNHMIFVKSFFKHNGNYKPDSVAALHDDFHDTFDKGPYFWSEFGENYREKLGKVKIVLQDPVLVNFLSQLFELKNDYPVPTKKVRALAFNKLKSEKISLSC